MKILVFSDSHHSTAGMIQAIDEQQPDQVIHLGDVMRDAEELSYIYPKLPIAMVPGNCDGWTPHPLKKLITLQGQNILLSHGHIWNVKSGYDAAILDAHKAGAQILLFGHTHRAICHQTADGLWVLNPGSSQTSFGTLLLEHGEIRCFVTPIP